MNVTFQALLVCEVASYFFFSYWTFASLFYSTYQCSEHFSTHLVLQPATLTPLFSERNLINPLDTICFAPYSRETSEQLAGESGGAFSSERARYFPQNKCRVNIGIGWTQTQLQNNSNVVTLSSEIVNG